MIPRYTRPEMGRIWSDENKYRCWLTVEIAASQALAKFGLVPQSAADAIRDRSGFTVARINEIEAEVKHDVIAFTTTVAEHINSPEDSRWLHYGLTSTDVVDTAQALQLKEASAIIHTGIVALSETLKKRAIEFKHTPIIGRTHGIHAEPSTFGLKLLLWYSEMQRNLIRFDAAAEDLRVGKLSGAVGTFGHLKPEHEEAICAELGLRPVEVATQVVQRDRHAAYVATLAVLASSLDKIATEIRHLQRTEVREAEEFFSEKQKGSSAMPHKRNPITSEQISGLARVMRANAQVALENVALWHERDISHSSAERVILPDSTILADYLLRKTEQLIAKLLVYPARMLKNLESTGGLIFSGQLLLDLAESGMSREDAYRLVQSHAMNSWKNGLIFRDEIAKVPGITARLNPEKLARAFDYNRQLANVDAIFNRVLYSSKDVGLKHAIVLEQFNLMKPIIAITVDAETRQDHEKLGIALAKLAQEDPTFHIQTQPPAGMFVISGMSELHLEKIIEYLTEKCEAQLVIGEPKVVYLETIRANGEAEGKYIRQMGPKGNYGHVKIRVAPNEYSKGYEFSNDTRDGSISSEYIPAIDQGLQEAMQGGVLVGYEMVDIKVSLFDGTYHEIDSNEMAFKIAASMAFKEAARKAKPVLLEPVMDVEVTISEEYMGTIIGDLNSRSGRIEGMEMVGRMQSIKATVPLRTMLGYATHLRSLAQGRANCSMQFKQYEEAPRPLGGHWSA